MARNIARYNPMSDLARPGVFPGIEELIRDFALAPMLRGMEQAPRMKVDIEENDKAYIVRAEVPGTKKEDIQISIDRNLMSIRADITEEKREEKSNMIRSERVFGEEFRTFALPQEVDESKAEAKYDNGVLTLTLPKKSGAGGRKLTVQ